MSNTFKLHNREGGVQNWDDLFTDLGFIRSVPNSGEYQVKAIRLDSGKDIVVVYDETAEA